MHIHSRAILHVDGDAFFASCEQALDISLKGKAVVTGHERGIASAMSCEAKKAGVTRGMPISEVRKVCPQAIVVSSNFTIYKIFSRRMYDIVRRYTPIVEEYSIDECFADITSPDTKQDAKQDVKCESSYDEIGRQIKKELEQELNMTFSIGIGPNKTLAKIASARNKPSGFTLLLPHHIDSFLERIPIEKVWGIGWATALKLKREDVHTALHFKQKTESWVKERFAKPYLMIWLEFHGHAVNLVETLHHEQKSIQRTRTFRPPSAVRDFVFSQLSQNLELACSRARARGLAFKELSFYLKTQEFTYKGAGFTLDTFICTPEEALEPLERHFRAIFIPGTVYRATGVTLHHMRNHEAVQDDLFGISNIRKGREDLYTKFLAPLSKKYRKNIMLLASSLKAAKYGLTVRPKNLLEHKKKIWTKNHGKDRFSLPYLGFVR